LPPGDKFLGRNNVAARTAEREGSVKNQTARMKITVFHCFNALNNTVSLESEELDVQSVRMPCSSLTREVFLLRAFEAGADAVAVIVCPLGACRYGEGNIRARKRVERMKKLLDEIGLDGRRLNIYNVEQGNEEEARSIISKTAAELASLGRNPAA
jgi:F420-non-reducing hydrogenase iron-sulfur subunit